ncbi:LysR family transcriptional regulator [Vibrio genomosp. F10]|uniref:LysR family transcriptional regulator n=1 Tax=Vibrio genomosp. F10 str. ZF-129 TaxID=1187848 RepID=A0A1E5BBB9_9VIBR|nr:LysR family transcriptional regulator [Vibrio genomosp. F10]OEE31414.1 LysR family transcriptional regulator [Vibrio genomosp. F10 str. ZF-129]OEE93627.1 LysR family transcriptional regulator [Vibrio genomosp. F10 str. 9ZC157]OEF10536.1 LysR family transcriptional regulator [Vibrio genomosp. F10 str. 9ZB36]
MLSPLTLEALHILDAIERRGSFASAAKELGRAPSSLTYQIQKLEQDLDLMIFDRSGHKAIFTQAGQLLLEQGRHILVASNDLVSKAKALANGWELDITIAFDGIIPVGNLFPLVSKLEEVSSTKVKLQEEILAGCWESLALNRADLLICPKTSMIPQDLKTEVIGSMSMVWVASYDHYIHKRVGEFNDQERQKYKIIAIADTALEHPIQSINILEKQPQLTVTTFNAKVEALLAGLGIGTLPQQVAEPLIRSHKLKAIQGTQNQDIEIVLAWRRNNMGNAKTWCIRYLKNHWSLLA